MKRIDGYVLLGRLGARIVDRDPTQQRRRKRLARVYMEDWHASHQVDWGALVRPGGWVGGRAFRVLMFCVSEMGYGNWIALRQADIAKELGMAQPNVSVALKKLMALGILEPGAKHGMRMGWVLHPRYGWKGDPAGKIERRDDGTVGFVGGGS